jgi:hypothetical protein
MPVGTHLVELLNEPMGLHEIFQVVVRKKQETTITRDFDSSGGHASLSIITKPESEVSIDGQWIGNTPIFGHLITPGSHDLALDHGQSPDPYTEVVDIEKGTTKRVFKLLAAKGPPLLE